MRETRVLRPRVSLRRGSVHALQRAEPATRRPPLWGCGSSFKGVRFNFSMQLHALSVQQRKYAKLIANMT